MMQSLFTTFFFLVSLLGFCQNTDNSLYDDIIKLTELSNKYSDQTIEFAEVLYEKASKKENKYVQIECLSAIAYQYEYLGEKEKALDYAKKLAKESEGINDVAYIDALRLEARLYLEQGIYGKAKTNLNEAEKFLNENKELKFPKENKQSRSSDDVYHTLKGSVYYDLFDVLNAEKTDVNHQLKYADFCISEYEKIKGKSKANYLPYGYIAKSDALAQKEMFSTALLSLEKAEESSNIDNKVMIASINAAKGKIYFHTKEYTKSIEFLTKAENPLKESSDVHVEILNYLFLNYQRLENKEKEAEYFTKYQTAKQEFDELNKNATNTMVKEIISKEKSIFEQIKDKLYLIISGIALLLAISVFISIRNHQTTKKQYARFREIIAELEQREIQLQQDNSDSANLISESDAVVVDENKKSSSITEKKEEELLKKLKQFEKSTKFTKNDLSLNSLASGLGTNTTYLSEIINQHKQKNFNQYINELRINHIIQKLKDEPKLRQFKIDALADEAGFNSRTSFSTVFTKIIGMSPSVFIKFLDKNQ